MITIMLRNYTHTHARTPALTHARTHRARTHGTHAIKSLYYYYRYSHYY